MSQKTPFTTAPPKQQAQAALERTEGFHKDQIKLWGYVNVHLHNDASRGLTCLAAFGALASNSAFATCGFVGCDTFCVFNLLKVAVCVLRLATL
jgi:hypothetical protein